jgi:predicted nucleic acid-binding protein
MYLVDTNIFLEVLLSQAKGEECKTFLKELAGGKKSGVVSDFTVHSIIVVMSNLGRVNELKVFLSSLPAYKGLRVVQTTLEQEINAADIALTQSLDMDDALQYAVALSLNVQAIVSYDHHFNKLKIPRQNPPRTT